MATLAYCAGNFHVDQYLVESIGHNFEGTFSEFIDVKNVAMCYRQGWASKLLEVLYLVSDMSKAM